MNNNKDNAYAIQYTDEDLKKVKSLYDTMEYECKLNYLLRRKQKPLVNRIKERQYINECKTRGYVVVDYITDEVKVY